VGTQRITPVATDNRPGLDAIHYRVGTHGSFLETMKADLAVMTVDAPGADGQTIEHFQPLTGFTTRQPSDPSIALLDGWAAVGDVLTFYQERNANEGFLRTATERRSVLELARLVGYTPRPGVSATAYLAYTVDEKQTDPVTLPVGTRSQTVPGPGELPQSFETSDVMVARSDWNNLQVRLSRPQNITFDTAATLDQIYVAGIATHLKPGDPLLLAFGADGRPAVMRTVKAIATKSDPDQTIIQLQPITIILKVLGFLQEFVKAVAAVLTPDQMKNVTAVATELRNAAVLGTTSLGVLFRELTDAAGNSAAVAALRDTLEKELASLVDSGDPAPADVIVTTDPSQFTSDLLRPAVVQARSSAALKRTLATSFRSGADLAPQLTIQFAPALHDAYYQAWANATVSSAAPTLTAVYALRVLASRFGAGVSKQPTYYGDNDQGHTKGELRPPSDWIDWPLDPEGPNLLYLDQAYPEILDDGLVVVQVEGLGTSREVRKILRADTVQRTAYGLSGKTTRLTLNALQPNDDQGDSMARLRSTLVYAQSEPLQLVNEPEPVDEVFGQEITLDRLYAELTSGRWAIISGERTDIPGVTGVRASELLMVSGLRQDFDPQLPGDKTRTTLLLATKTAYRYKRSTVTIYGNVVKATNGETRNETLGSGDGSQSLQSFALKQSPLTFVAAPNPAGVDSTLAVYVNDVEWHEAPTLAGLGPRDRRFITRTDDAGTTTVIFGTGVSGARLPTGVENVKAIYRNGIGAPGNARAEQISQLQTRPLGVKSVINPLRASGGADRETRDQARLNAPLAVMSLDRVVSLSDYADFTRTFAGIDKALAKMLTDGRGPLVQVTIAGADDIPIDPASDLYRNLVLALEELGDPGLSLQVDARELVALVLSANIRINPDYLWNSVESAVRAALLDGFGFERAELGTPVLLSKVESRMQAVPGVDYIDIDAFGGIPERKANASGERVLLSLDELSARVKAIASRSRPAQRVRVHVAAVDHGRVRPAQLAVFTPAVADTLILNQIP
jgi:predicted phage baseplate assembly protein